MRVHPLRNIGLRVAAATFALALLLAVSQRASAGPAIVFEARSGEVLHAHEPFARWYPASLTKLMTAYVTFRAIRERRVSVDTPVRISEFAHAQPPSKMGFSVGTQISLEYAMRILMVKSANDIAVAVAETVGGSLPAFVSAMNSAAARLGMTDTRFVNPHGLPDERQVTTARDLALLARALILEFPQYQHFFQTQSIQVGDKVYTNHNKLIGRFRGADGLKTGFICASGFNLAASATRNGRRLVAIVLGAQNARYREEVAAGLLEAGFSEAGGGGIFSLFTRRGPTLADLRRPSAVPTPVDLRPYVCQNRTMPARLASFGTTATAGEEEIKLSPPVVGQGAAFALAGASVVGLPSAARRSEPVVAFSVPVPRPRPLTAPSAGVDVGPAIREASTAGSTSEGTRLPLPNPVRVPLR